MTFSAYLFSGTCSTALLSLSRNPEEKAVNVRRPRNHCVPTKNRSADNGGGKKKYDCGAQEGGEEEEGGYFPGVQFGGKLLPRNLSVANGRLVVRRI